MGNNLSKSQKTTIFVLSGITFLLSAFWFAKENLQLENYFAFLHEKKWYENLNIEPLVTFFASSIPVVTLYWPFKPKYKSARISGHLTIPMYNTKKIEIGKDDYKFVPSLSHGGTTCQHFYVDHPSVRGSAIISDASKFEDVKDATGYPVNNQSKLAYLDDIILVKNRHGKYALISIISVKETTGNVKGFDVEIEYVINPTGGVNFS